MQATSGSAAEAAAARRLLALAELMNQVKHQKFIGPLFTKPMDSCHERFILHVLIILHGAQTVGDAVSVILMVMAALVLLGMDLPAWAALYSDVPSRQLKACSFQ